MKKLTLFISAILLASCLSGCFAENGNSSNEATETSAQTIAQTEIVPTYNYEQELNIIDDNYRNYYEIFVYSFCDSDGDGIGDINGMTSKLDYISEMGFNGIWLMPIMKSTTYHKYDVVDYYEIDEQYGTKEDFANFISECEKRDINVIIDFVFNHSSTKHEWFSSACESLKTATCGEEICSSEDGLCSEHNPYIDYYNFTTEKPAGENGWYPVYGTDYFYEAVFWDQMPDFNLANEDLRRDIEDIANYWLTEMGVSGFRLDAAKEFYSGNVDANIEVLKWFCDYVKSVKSDAYIVAEVWSSFTNYTEYYKSGIDSVFGFTMAEGDGKIAKTLNSTGYNNSTKAFVEALSTIEKKLASYNENAIDAPFISNHDHDRSSGFLRNDSDKIKIAAGMLLTMKGSPFVYYGEEIGMAGSGIDENKRAPMLWNEDKSSAGMTYGPPKMNPITHNFASVEAQLDDPDSILNYYKRALRIRNENPEIARGETETLPLISSDVCAVRRSYDGSEIIVVYNLSEKDYSLSDEILSLDTNKIRGYLTVSSQEEVTLENSTLTMPAYSIAILKA